MTMHKALHPRGDVDRLYVSRKEGEKRTCQHQRQRSRIDTTTRRLHRKINEGLITAIKQYRQHDR